MGKKRTYVGGQVKSRLHGLGVQGAIGMVFFFLLSTKLFLLFSFLCYAFYTARRRLYYTRLYVAFYLSRVAG